MERWQEPVGRSDGQGGQWQEWRPSPGQVALIEPVEPQVGRDCYTGPVMPDGAGRLLVDLGAAGKLPAPICEVVASFFAPDGLYRLSAKASALDESAGMFELNVQHVDRVQRRTHPRVMATLPVSLAAFDGPGPFMSVTGETVDVAPGGCRVVTSDPFPRDADPTISIRLPDEGPPVVALARILDTQVQPGRYEYRMVFAAIEAEDRERLAHVRSA